MTPSPVAFCGKSDASAVAGSSRFALVRARRVLAMVVPRCVRKAHLNVCSSLGRRAAKAL